MANAVAVFTPGQRITDEDGAPYAYAYIRFYEAETETPKEVYADADLSVSLGSTVYTDSGGYPVAGEGSTTRTLVYANADFYHVRGYTEEDVVIFDHPREKGAVVEGSTVGGSFLTQDAADVRYTRNANALSGVTTLTTGDKIPVYVAAASGNRHILWEDLSDDLLAEWKTAGHVLASGARILFNMTTPPTGWVKETNAAYNDAVMTLTTGSVTTGGSVTTPDIFKTHTLSGTVGDSTPTIARTAAHNHTANDVLTDSGLGAASYGAGFANGTTVNRNTTSTGGGDAHAHSLTMNSMNLTAKFVGATVGQKS